MGRIKSPLVRLSEKAAMTGGLFAVWCFGASGGKFMVF